jgi:peptidoglycan/LPS O-acetylase OafA/YrhL
MADQEADSSPRPADLSAPRALGQFRTLDAWRGFAALSVVAVHAIGPVHDQVPVEQRNALLRFGMEGGIGVPIFFVISGYCIAQAAVSCRGGTSPLRAFAKRRLRRIFPPYWIAALLFVLHDGAAQVLQNLGVIGASKAAGHAVLSQGWSYWVANASLANYPLRQEHLVTVGWTLSYEVAFYAIVGAFLWATRSCAETTFLTALHALSGACAAVLIVRPDWAVYPTDFWPLFGLGVLVFDLSRRRTGPWPWIVAGVVALLSLVVALENLRWGVGLRGMVGMRTYGPALLTAAILVATKPFDERISANRVVRVLGKVGFMSYSIYLTHILAMGVIHHAARVTGMLQSAPIAVAAGAAAAGLAFGVVFFRFAERPFLRRKLAS